VPEIAEITVEFHRIGLHPRLNPTDAGIDILQPEMLAAETRFLYFMHDLPSFFIIEQLAEIRRLSLCIGLTAIEVDHAVLKAEFAQIL
jgi:hypothetical protein